MPAAAPAVTAAGLPVRPERAPRRTLGELAAAVPALRLAPGSAATVVSGCTLDSRSVQAGDLYAALPGARAHGADFASQAAAAGAAAVLTDEAGAARARAAGLPVVVTDDPRAVLGVTAAEVHGHPGRAMTVLGVTGTNGKTTTAFLLDAGLRAAGHHAGLLGTVLTRVGPQVVPSVRTTPEAPDLQGLLAVMRERGITAVAMEVSSHALAFGRVDGLVFDVAAFTNLSQDHLDFHADMAAYEAAKAQLFTPARSRAAVVNAGDAAGRRIAAAGLVPTVTYGEGGDWQARDVELRPDGSSFRLVGPGVDCAAAVRLPGAFNVANAVGALVTLVTAGVPLEAAVEGVAGLPGVPGRMERVDAGQDFLALVDYAHTPEAVTTLLQTVRAVTSGRVVLVLGCGGDRDRGKRPLMGRAAVEGADVAVLTSDNPRSEDPAQILREMAAPGAVLEPDRRAAIAAAVAMARPGDAVVVAGKGHESGQEAGGVVTPFDDREVLRELLGAGQAPVHA
ncbi:MAG TPA: UDP-N-acetylmuramoyl-L-alanyl-D-glutamate--2,6-diaminopimelate ligase [Mycobacteriales bacterium]|nr:UDP-N-acetylmuramoyl-L-alanyl-D-glutamate--2,6-diaminopimelate ligase [Mycobacteriales bacterium]